jgi:hypothetical protein
MENAMTRKTKNSNTIRLITISKISMLSVLESDRTEVSRNS